MNTHAPTEEGTLLVFTVLAVVILSAFTSVAVGGARFADAGGHVLTRIQLASIHTLVTEITCRTRKKKRETKRVRSDIRTLMSRKLGSFELVTARVTWVADTGVCAPVVAALAVLRADVGVAGVIQVAAVLHADLQTLSHVHVGHVGGRLAHAHTLVAEKRKER